MNFRQSIVKLIYPLLAKVSRRKRLNMNFNANEHKIKPIVSFYSLSALANNGRIIDFNEFKNKKVLLVNTASDCGYTPQFDGLQQLQDRYKDTLTVVGFPSNDFGEQEKGDDDQIAQFCKVNYGVSFQLVKKSHVLKNERQNEVFKWLSDKNKNGWNEQAPQWNFCKYLIDNDGTLLNYFASGVEPFDKQITDLM